MKQEAKQESYNKRNGIGCPYSKAGGLSLLGIGGATVVAAIEVGFGVLSGAMFGVAGLGALPIFSGLWFMNKARKADKEIQEIIDTKWKNTTIQEELHEVRNRSRNRQYYIGLGTLFLGAAISTFGILVATSAITISAALNPAVIVAAIGAFAAITATAIFQMARNSKLGVIGVSGKDFPKEGSIMQNPQNYQKQTNQFFTITQFWGSPEPTVNNTTRMAEKKVDLMAKRILAKKEGKNAQKESTKKASTFKGYIGL